MNSCIRRPISKQAGRYLREKVNSGIKIYILFACIVLVFTAAPSSPSDHTPEYLEPVRPYCGILGGYTNLVFRALIGDRYPEAWMIARPSFQPEYAVLLRKGDLKDSTGVHYDVEYAVAEQEVWHWKDAGDGTKTLDPRENVVVSRQVARLPDELATSVLDTWKAVILKTRYVEKDWIGLDGVTYEFYSSPDFYGQTWSPDSGIPKMMVDCGELLIEYAKGSDSDRPKITDQIRELIAEMEKAIE